MKRTDKTVLSDLVGQLLRDARKDLKISREQLARRAQVSSRLVAELERGQRPNVSLESALKLLTSVGTMIALKAPGGQTIKVQTEKSAGIQRRARAEIRRNTWTGGHVPLHSEGQPPLGGISAAQRLAAVSAISRQSFRIASSPKSAKRA